jgi:signal transduction histidine kinase
MSKATPTHPNPLNESLLTLSAILTWAAILLSEFFQLNGTERLVFIGAAIAFLIAFLIENRRKRLGWSLALITITVSAAIAIYLGGFGATPALLVIGGVTLFEKLPTRQFWAVIAVLNAVLLFRLLKANPPMWALSGFAAYLGFQIFGNMMVSSSRAVETVNRELLSINAELISTRALLSESARAQERLRLSRELHDVCGHKLTALKLTLRGRGDAGALEASERALCQTLTDELLSDIRAVVATLREHEGINLAHALNQLGSGWKRPLVTVLINPEVRVPNLDYAVALLRVAQEGLTNVARHSNAAKVEIALTQEAESTLTPNGSALILSVSDNGSGAPKLIRGNGLNGMAERLAALGGSLEITQLAPGLRLAARLPMLEDAPL